MVFQIEIKRGASFDGSYSNQQGSDEEEFG
jgi:hypothetical protein